MKTYASHGVNTFNLNIINIVFYFVGLFMNSISPL